MLLEKYENNGKMMESEVFYSFFDEESERRGDEWRVLVEEPAHVHSKPAGRPFLSPQAPRPSVGRRHMSQLAD